MGNGETKTFPLPSGADGRSVFLCLPNGQAVRMKEGDAYRVEGGNVVFELAPAEGWSVTFEGQELITKSLCTVVYPDGTVRKVERDPWELLTEAKKERESMRELLNEVRKERTVQVVSINALAAETKESMKSRLLDYDAKAENAISAAVKASADDVSTTVNKNLLEIRNKHKAVVDLHTAVDEARQEAVEAANDAAVLAAGMVNDTLASLNSQTQEAYARVREMRSEILGMKDAAQNAAADAGVKVTASYEQRTEVLLTELKSIRNALDHEIKGLVERARRDSASELEQAKTARDEGVRAARRAEEIERNCKASETRVLASERNIQAFAEKITEFQILFESRIAEYRAALEAKK